VRSTARATIAFLSVVLGWPGLARADDPNVFRYVVKKGQDCPAVAAENFGDRSRVDLVHALNPDLGPVPHHLREGQELLLPKALSGPPAPDATLVRARNKVEVRAPELRPPAVPDPLFAGNRVSTATASTADLDFRDETRVRLGESSLIVILGSSAKRSPITPAASASLLDGSVRARLSALAGRLPDKPAVDTPSARIAMKQGEAQISVDPKRTTRLAVYSGGSTISAQKATVAVEGGFGSKADDGSPPTPPRPLPAAPTWTAPPPSLALFGGLTASVLGDYGAGAGPGDAPAEWHLQLAKDEAFDDLLVDTRVPLAVTRLDARELAEGRYFVRVSAIDADVFEGPWSEVRSVSAVRVETVSLGRRRTRVVAPAGIACALDGAPIQGAVDVGRSVVHHVSCTAGPELDGDLVLEPVAVSSIRAELAVVERRGASGMLRLTVTDEAGEPLEGVVPTLLAPEGVDLGPLVAESGPGAYRATFRARVPWRGALVVQALALATATNEADFTPAVPPEPRRSRLEIMVAGGGSLRGLSRAGFAGRAGLDVVIPTGKGAIAIGGVVAIDHQPAALVTIDDTSAPARGSVTWLGGRIPLELRPSAGSGVTGHLAIGPEVGRQTTDLGSTSTSSLTLGAWLAGGAGIDTGAGRAFVEASLRAAAAPFGAAQPAASTVGLSVGFRFRP